VVRAKGAVVAVKISAAASKFAHRGELVYLPPAWFATNPPPRLPAVMMIGGEFNTPADWLRAGEAITAIDAFAAAHSGNAPVFVFVDSGGGFNIDTECVNGVRGNAADHLTKDVIPFLASNFSVSSRRSDWGVAGFLRRRHLRRRLDSDASRAVRHLRRHRRGPQPELGEQGADHRPPIRR
jgi:S-formylglutathione hydrolase FrmB